MSPTGKTLAETAVAAVVALQTQLVASGATWARDRVEREVAQVRAQLDAAVTTIRQEFGVNGWQAVNDLLVVGLALADLAIQVNTGKTRVVEWGMPAPGNAALAAFYRYKDISRRQEIIDLNALRDPNRIPLGTVLRVYAS